MGTMVENRNTDKIAILSITFPRARELAKRASERTSEYSGGRKGSELSGASEQASGPVLTYLFLFVPDHRASSSLIDTQTSMSLMMY